MKINLLLYFYFVLLSGYSKELFQRNKSELGENKFNKVGIITSNYLLHSDSVMINFDVKRLTNQLETETGLSYDSIQKGQLVTKLKNDTEQKTRLSAQIIVTIILIGTII